MWMDHCMEIHTVQLSTAYTFVSFYWKIEMAHYGSQPFNYKPRFPISADAPSVLARLFTSVQNF